MGFWPVVLNVLKNSDIVLLLVDARMPEMTRNGEIIRKVEQMNKRLIIVFNKIDLIGKKDIGELKDKYPKAFFVSGSKGTGIQELKDYLEKTAEERTTKSTRVGVVGYPNIGKSSLINFLAKGARVKVSSVSGTTKKTQWVRSGKLRIMDSPGVIPMGDRRVQVGMVAAKDPHKIKNPDKVAIRIIEFLTKKDPKILKREYGAEGESAYDVFSSIGDKKKYRIKGGDIDEHRTAIKIIDDWQKGKIKLK
jgi:ribosome biogenesis GTPase A